MYTTDNCVRILYVHGGILARGGTEAYMMNYYRHFDHSKLQVDFVVHGDGKGVYDEEIQTMGGRILRVPLKSKKPLGYIKALRKIFNSGEYKIVHAHIDAMNWIVLKIAKQCGMPVRISHSHSTFIQTSNKQKIWLNNQVKKMIPNVATHLFACSGIAGKWLYGDMPYQVKPNAVNITRFSFNLECRRRIRDDLLLSDEDIVLGHVGRFGAEKNHQFLVSVLEQLCRDNPHYKLVLIGDGPLKEAIQNQVTKAGLHNAVRFVDACPNVNEYYNAFDWFCLPSIFEGLPTVGIEAQANGMHCIISDTVSRELDKTGNVTFLPIGEQGIQEWVRHFQINAETQRDPLAADKLKRAGYEISKAADDLQRFYLSMYT